MYHSRIFVRAERWVAQIWLGDRLIAQATFLHPRLAEAWVEDVLRALG